MRQRKKLRRGVSTKMGENIEMRGREREKLRWERAHGQNRIMSFIKSVNYPRVQFLSMGTASTELILLL